MVVGIACCVSGSGESGRSRRSQNEGHLAGRSVELVSHWGDGAGTAGAGTAGQGTESQEESEQLTPSWMESVGSIACDWCRACNDSSDVNESGGG